MNTPPPHRLTVIVISIEFIAIIGLQFPQCRVEKTDGGLVCWESDAVLIHGLRGRDGWDPCDIRSEDNRAVPRPSLQRSRISRKSSQYQIHFNRHLHFLGLTVIPLSGCNLFSDVLAFVSMPVSVCYYYCCC